MLRKAHLNLIARHSLKHGLRGGAGLVSIALTLMIGLVLSQCAVGPLETVDKIVAKAERGGTDQHEYAKKEANKQLIVLASQVMKWTADPSDEQLEYLTEDKPAMISVLLVLLFFATPLFGCLGGFNQTAGDIGTKGLRFLLFRTERANIFWGRFLGTLAFTAMVNLLLFVILGIYMAAKIKVHPAGDTLMWMAQGYLRLMVFTVPYVALCAWISSAMESAFGALAISLLVAFFAPLIFGFIGGVMGAGEQIKYFQLITPWGYKYWLLEPMGLKFFGGILVMSGFSALFLWLGHRNFSRRDL